MNQFLIDHRIIPSTNPIPIDEEIRLDPSKSIMSKTDTRGVIEYANDYFMSISGYEEFELMGQAHNVIRHPDMPKVIFKIMWKELKNGKPTFAIVKNMSKDGRYYWVLVNFEIRYDEEGKIESYYAHRKAVPDQAKFKIQKLYKKLRAIENNQSIEVAYKYFEGMLEEERKTYEDFIIDILEVEKNIITSYFEKDTVKKQKKGLFSRIFKL